MDVVVLDECHERHLDADTVAAFLWDVRQALRPELRLVAASATTDAQGWSRLLGGAPVVEAAGTAHPVEVVWAPPVRPVRPPHGMRVDPALLAHVASVVRRALAERDGDVLCFLPGVGEIARVAAQLGAPAGVEVLQCTGGARGRAGGGAVRRGAAAGGAGDVGRGVLADRARGAGGGGLGAGPGAPGGSCAGAQRADDGTGVAGGRAAAGGPGRAGGTGRGVPVLGGGRGRPSAGVPGAGDQGGRPDVVRAPDGLLGRSGRLGSCPVGSAAGRCDGGGALRAGGGGRGGLGGAGDGTRRTALPAGAAPSAGPGAAGHVRGGGGGGRAALGGGAAGVRRRSRRCVALRSAWG